MVLYIVQYNTVQYTIMQYGGFCNLGTLFAGVLIIRALLFWLCVRAPDFWKLQ